jgi:hypothetical protein
MGARIELLVRLVLIFVLGILLGIWGIWISICWILQFIIILITGKRNKFFNGQINKYFKFYVKCYEYFLLLTDKRPI